MQYPVTSVEQRDEMEQLGTKRKFWFFNPETGDRELFKHGRPNTGENWSEKAAYELAKLFGIPCASYELATFKNKDSAGVCSPNFVPQGSHLRHANELLSVIDKQYDKERGFELKQYQLISVLDHMFVMKEYTKLPINFSLDEHVQADDILELFIGYLMFDAWIGNQDRHDQNWGILVIPHLDKKASYHFAPSFDHASSLACRMSDEQKEARLTTKDKGFQVEAFASKASTPFYRENKKRLKTFECLKLAIEHTKKQEAMQKWFQRLESIKTEDIQQVFARFPQDGQWISDISVEFTLKYLDVNRKKILQLGKEVNE